MTGCLRSCLGRTVALVGLVLLLALGFAAWQWGPTVYPPLGVWLGRDTPAADAEASPELADATMDRLEAFRAGEGPDRLALGAPALSSLVRYGLPGALPPGVTAPLVGLEEGRLLLSGSVATRSLPDLGSLREATGFLPDTVQVAMRVNVLPFDDEHLTLHVERVVAAGIPLPERFVPDILRALGREDRTGLRPDALLLPLPRGLDRVYVLKDSLVLQADRQGT